MRKQYKYFVLTEYEKEEAFLRYWHKHGFKLEKVKLPGIYYFEECEPEDVVYKLDFNPLAQKDKENYLQMFEDYGWEYIQDMNEYSYFRKKASETSEQENEIFLDDNSRLEMLERIFKRKILPILCVFGCFIIVLTLNIHHIVTVGFAGNIISLTLLMILVLYVGLVYKLVDGYTTIKNKLDH